MNTIFSQDAMQANLGFVLSQTSHVETQVYNMRYPAIQYPSLIPVDTSANPWVKTVTYFSADKAGKADWINGKARDIPLASTARQKHETDVFMAGIGYSYSLEEVQQAQMLGISLANDDAMASRRAYEEFVDRIALHGDADKGFEGLFNHGAVSPVSAAKPWMGATAEEIHLDLNNMITGVFISTNTVALADTILLPWERYNYIATTPRSDNSDKTILQYFIENNVYTAQTGQKLTIRGVLGLVKAGTGGTARAIAYRRDPEVMKLHIPMVHQFLPVQVVIMEYIIPGIFRLGGLDIRLPKEVTYLDGI